MEAPEIKRMRELMKSNEMTKEKFENIQYNGATAYEHTEAYGFHVVHSLTLYVAGEPVAVREIINGEINYYGA